MKKIVVYFNSMNAAGGIERVIANLSNQWSKKYQIILLTKDSQESFYPLEACVERVSLNIPLYLNMHNRKKRIISVGFNFIKSLYALKKCLNLIAFDYIYVATPLTAFEVFLIGKRYRQHLIVSEHSSNFAYNRIYRLMRKIVYPRVYKLSVPTISDTELYLKKGYDAVYIPHLSTFPITKCNECKTHTMINVGRLTADKQQLLLLKIWKNFLDRHPNTDWQLKIIGTGEEEQRLCRYIEENRLTNVNICPPTPNIDQYYKTASVFLFTSKLEGFGMVLLEAMAYGAVCVSFDCPSGPRDIIRNNYNGYLIPCYNEELFCDALEKISDSHQLRERLSENAYNTVGSWDNDKIIDSWDKLFGEDTDENKNTFL